jgi:hypothetical protein
VSEVNRTSTGCLPAASSLRGMTTHHSHRLARLVVAGLATGALAAPAAVAQPLDAQPRAATGSEPDAPVVRTINEGFDWGSAAVGAGGAGAALVLSLGAFTFVSRDRMRVAR